MGKHAFYDGRWDIEVRRNGVVVSQDLNVKNGLSDAGERLMLNCFFRGLETPSSFYVRLSSSVLAENSTLPITGNVTNGGFTPLTIERSAVGFPVLEMDDGDYRVITKEVTATATGGSIGPFRTLVLTTSSDDTGDLVAYVTLPTSRTVLEGDQLVIRIRIKLS